MFVERIEGQIQLLRAIPFAAKFGGATGNLNAHYITFPDIDWISFSSILIWRGEGRKQGTEGEENLI